jgi:hypothetical protein
VGHKRRDRETQDDIKAGKQLNLFLYTPLESIDDQTPSVTSVDPLPPVKSSSSEPGVIHDVVDEEEVCIESFSDGNLLDDKIEAARASLRQPLNHRSASFPPESAARKGSSVKKKSTVKSNADQSLIFFERLPGKIQPHITKINSIPGYLKNHPQKHPWLAPA